MGLWQKLFGKKPAPTPPPTPLRPPPAVATLRPAEPSPNEDWQEAQARLIAAEGPAWEDDEPQPAKRKPRSNVCPDCDGDGWVSASAAGLDGPPRAHSRCPSCGGAGRIRGAA